MSLSARCAWAWQTLRRPIGACVPTPTSLVARAGIQGVTANESGIREGVAMAGTSDLEEPILVCLHRRIENRAKPVDAAAPLSAVSGLAPEFG